MTGDLPRGFLRAEADWLQPPDDGPFTREEIDEIKERANSELKEFRDFIDFNVESSDELDGVVFELQGFTKNIKTLRDELQNAEENAECEFDPDAEYDRRAEMGCA